MNIRDYLIVSSVDGTLFRAGYGIPGANIDAVEDFTSRGGRFTFCTSRSRAEAERTSEWLRLTAPAVLDSGNYLYDFENGDVLYEKTLGENARTVVEDVLRMFPNLGAVIAAEPILYVPVMNRAVEERTAKEHTRFRLCDLADIPEGWHRAAFIGPVKELMAARKYAYLQQGIQEEFASYRYVLTSGGTLELAAEESGKASGLKLLCERTGTDLSHVIGLGSGEDDIDFVKLCGFKAAVGDAPARLRNVCDLTLPACLKGGAAELIGKFDDITGNYEQIALDE